MHVVVCPGIHDPQLTQHFVTGILQGHSWSEQQGPDRVDFFHLHILPTQTYPPYSGLHILTFLHEQRKLQSKSVSPLLFIGFSAGVVGAIAAARRWQTLGGTVQALIALDGWGVPLLADFPIHRVSHDRFTGWSSALLGRGQDSFYADPAVEHLELWRSPHTTQGWWMDAESSQHPIRTTVASFVSALLKRYGNQEQSSVRM